MTEYTAEETATFLHQLDDRVSALEGRNTEPEPDIVTVMQATKVANCSRRTIYNWIAAGKVRYCRVPSGKVRIYRDSLFSREGPISVD